MTAGLSCQSGKVRSRAFTGGNRRLFRLGLIAGAVFGCLTGCTYSDPPSAAVNPHTDSPSVPSSAPSMAPMTLKGQFESQGFVTSGSATTRVTETGAVLQLDDFSTGSGEDLRLMLSPGTLSPSDKGEPGLSSTTLFDLGPLKEGPSQRIEMDLRMWSAIQAPVRSVVVFNYADKIAYGTPHGAATLSGQRLMNTATSFH